MTNNEVSIGTVNDVQKYQFEELKNGRLFPNQIKDFTDEMKWWLIENDKFIPVHCELTEEMIYTLIKLGSDRIGACHLKDFKVPEEYWIEGINNCDMKFISLFNGFLFFVLENAVLTEEIALALCIKYPLFWTDERIKKIISNKNLAKISESFFEGLKNKVNWHFELPKELPISNEQWQWIVDNEYLLHCTGRVEDYISERNDVPQFVRHDTLKKRMYLKEWGKISSDDLIFWLKTYEKQTNDWYFTESVKYYINCDDMESVMKECGWFIKYWKNQSFKLCKAAIDCNPKNIQYVKKITDKLAIYALSLDKSVLQYVKKTKAVCDYLGISFEDKKEYPSEYYLVKFKEDLCDEGYLIKVCIVKGKDIEKFLEKTTCLSFGNLYDDNERKVKKIAQYQPITEDELKVLKKFGLDDLESGYFSDLD